MGRIRLMLADDEAPILEAMCELMSTDRYIDVVGTARDAGEAIHLAELHEPDVALLDVRMPGGGGSRAAREIRKRSPETRIVALSASTDPRTVASMVRAGAMGYVGKDQPADEVLRAIHRSVDGRASIAVDRLGEVWERLTEHQALHVVKVAERARVSTDRIEAAIRGDVLETVFQPIVDLSDGRVRGVGTLAETAPERPSQTHGVETVLLVEDEPMVLELGARVLRSHGYRVLVASNATEALQVAREHAGKVDLLLTDVVMPGLPGPELAARLETVTSGLRVLYMSGYADDSVARFGTEEGISFLAKPFSGEALAARVREVLDQPRRR